MADPRVANCLFCDDIRVEVGNKFSLMGVYGGEMLIAATFPVQIAKLGIMVWLISDVDDKPKRVVTSVILPDGTELLSTEVPSDFPVQNIEGSSKMNLTQVIPISPMPIPKEGMIEVWVETERGKIRAGRLLVRSASTVNLRPNPEHPAD